MHLPRRALVDVAERVFQGVLAHPDRSGKIIPLEIRLRLGDRIVVIDLLRSLDLVCF